MKAKITTTKMPAGSRASFAASSLKKISVFILVLVALMPLVTKAQSPTGVLTGTGMGVCSGFSFNSTAGTPITPLNYGNQYYACTGANSDDVSFSPQGNTWRVEKLSWHFIATTTTGGRLNGFDATGTPISQVSLPTNQWLQPVTYTVVSGVNCVIFYLNGSPLPGVYDRSNFTIEAP